MSLLDYFRSKPQAQKAAPRAAHGGASQQWFRDLDDPLLLEFMRGSRSESGAYVSATSALHNSAVSRCVRLISESIGMLPLNIVERGPEKRRAEELPLFQLLKLLPNSWQTAHEFKAQMQMNALIHGNAYALIVRSAGRVIRLVPLDPLRVTPELSADWEMVYKYQPDEGPLRYLPSSEIFHLRDLSLDGVSGMSRVKLATEAVGLAMQAERAAARLFRNGMMVGGALTHPGTLTTEAYERLQQSMADRYSGSENAHRWMILEEGMNADKFSQTASDSQHIENRTFQIEEIARAFGVPRPLLMMDETSWGSGVEQLGIFFVQYTLAPWFNSWEQAIARSLMTPAERERFYAKFNERALLRGTLKDQAEYFTKALGSGGHSPWMSTNEVRELSEMPESDDPTADLLVSPLMRNAGVANDNQDTA